VDNVALQFFGLGDTPYDENANTCVAADGRTKLNPCTLYECTNIATLAEGNSCTYEGSDYNCVKNHLIPYMNARIAAGDAAFIAHAGDIMKGIAIPEDGVSINTRCNPHSFASRRELFQLATNFQMVPGDNDWNECIGYLPNANNGDLRDLWRNDFANANSPFHQFDNPFPDSSTGPIIERHVTNPEIFYFVHNKVAFFGINRVVGQSYVNSVADPDPNTEWIKGKLALQGCDLQSIIILSHRSPKSEVYDAIDTYDDNCGRSSTAGDGIPILTITGNTHPASYCMTRSNESSSTIHLTVEAFESGPVLVSVVRGPNGEGDFFHVEDVDPANSNNNCPMI